jgi:UDP-N-acetylmuramyl pentapeptide phosphotransferase/UDP-N-acetylglucosamine-1-phosphate transferase
MRQSGDALAWLNEFGGIVPLAAGAISFVLLLWLKPVLSRYAVAKPNVRSSHKTPTPQGGGIAVIAATVVVFATIAIFSPALITESWRLAVVFVSAIALAVIGITDDIRPIAVLPRLLLQAIAVVTVVASLPDDLRVLVVLPWWIERALIFVAVLWFVNLVNFMDGIDWMTVVEVVPLSAGLSLFGLMGALSWDATLVALALCGAMVGFAPFNRPVARLFLGDVGTLPIGLLLGWLLILLAGSGHLAAALILPLYYLADATITLLCRLINREPVLQAHRSHFYQQAIDGKYGVYQVVGRVFALNIILIGLATVTVMTTSTTLHIIMLAASSAIVGILLWNFRHAYRR